MTQTNDRSLPDPAIEPTITVPRAATILGISRASGYTFARTGGIPTVKVGDRVLVPTAKFLATFDLVA